MKKVKLYNVSTAEHQEMLNLRGWWANSPADGDDSTATERLIEKYKKMVLFIANRCISLGVKKEFDDLVQTGYLAIIDAARSYKDQRDGNKMSTHIYNLIRWRMLARRGSDKGNIMEIDDHNMLGFDALVKGEEECGLLLHEVIPAKSHNPFDEVLGREIQDILSTLPLRLQKIIHMRFENNMKLQEIGSVLGITRERSRQLEGKALEMLREKLQPRNVTT